jgi:hypothetical protein
VGPGADRPFGGRVFHPSLAPANPETGARKSAEHICPGTAGIPVQPAAAEALTSGQWRPAFYPPNQLPSALRQGKEMAHGEEIEMRATAVLVHRDLVFVRPPRMTAGSEVEQICRNAGDQAAR